MSNNGNAGCLCGAVRLQVDGAPVAVTQCHCRDCQKCTGGGVVLVVMIPKDNLKIVQGNVSGFTKKSDDGNDVTRCFCGTCGTQLYSELQAYPNLIAAKSGMWDGDPGFLPSSSVWTSSAPEWHHVLENLPQFPKART